MKKVVKKGIILDEERDIVVRSRQYFEDLTTIPGERNINKVNPIIQDNKEDIINNQ